jgi:hypothetical protein
MTLARHTMMCLPLPGSPAGRLRLPVLRDRDLRGRLVAGHPPYASRVPGARRELDLRDASSVRELKDVTGARSASSWSTSTGIR